MKAGKRHYKNNFTKQQLRKKKWANYHENRKTSGFLTALSIISTHAYEMKTTKWWHSFHARASYPWIICGFLSLLCCDIEQSMHVLAVLTFTLLFFYGSLVSNTAGGVKGECLTLIGGFIFLGSLSSIAHSKLLLQFCCCCCNCFVIYISFLHWALFSVCGTQQWDCIC